MSRENKVFERPNIQQMQGYTWGEQPNDAETIKLNTNENPYPPSPMVQQTLSGLDVASLRTYPQPTADPLRDALAQHHNIRRDNIVITHGGDEALRLAFTTFAQPGSAFGMAQPSYSLYPVLAQIQDAKIVQVPLAPNWSMPTDFAAQLNEQNVNLCCLVNPHAPSGTLSSAYELQQIAEQLNGVLVIDEAYADFVDPDLDYDTTALLASCNNVLILRTFSKGYSLAGLRLGYLMGAPTLIQPIVNKTRDSYNIDHISQQLGLAALQDQKHATDIWNKVRSAREILRNNLSQLGLHSPGSQTNFVLVSVTDDLPINAETLYLELKQQGVLVRHFPTLPDKLRITVGTPAQNQTLLEGLGNLLKK